jgi:chaperone required for assembly of F1-ATPase
MKRFYSVVGIEEKPQGYGVTLDGKPVRTPGGAPLLAPVRPMAEAIAAEWGAQKERIEPQTMPITQILCTLIDQVSAQRPAMTREILNYLPTDLLCYRASDEPPGMQAAQAAAWDPWLDWFESTNGTRLETTTALAALDPPAAAHESARAYVEALDDPRFTVLQIVVPLSGSLILGMAFCEGAITAAALFSAIRVEETLRAKIYNEDLYGPDPAQSKKDAATRIDLEAAEAFLKFLR